MLLSNALALQCSCSAMLLHYTSSRSLRPCSVHLLKAAWKKLMHEEFWLNCSYCCCSALGGLIRARVRADTAPVRYESGMNGAEGRARLTNFCMANCRAEDPMGGSMGSVPLTAAANRAYSCVLESRLFDISAGVFRTIW